MSANPAGTQWSLSSPEYSGKGSYSSEIPVLSGSIPVDGANATFQPAEDVAAAFGDKVFDMMNKPAAR